jgi:hypothetical protein
MNIPIVDVVLHIDETLDRQRRSQIEDALRAMDGVVSIHNPDDRPHLCVIAYNHDKTSSAALLRTVTNEGVHAELIGL